MISICANGWEVTLYYEEEAFHANLVLVAGLQILNVEVYGVKSLSPYQSLRVEKVNRKYAVIGGCLIGGGGQCVKPKKKSEEPKHKPYLHIAALRSLDSNQKTAANIVDRINKLICKGNFTSFELNKLDNIPIASVEFPLSVVKSLIDILSHDNIWKDQFRFQTRHSLARHARRYFLDFFIQRRKGQTAMDLENKILDDLFINMRTVQNKATAIDSGLKIEFKIMRRFLNQLDINQQWWVALLGEAPLLFEIYTSIEPVPLLVKSSKLLEQIGSFSKEALVERCLMIDRLYAMKDQPALDQFIDIMQTDQPWEIRFLALTYVEWALHSGIFKKEVNLDVIFPKLDQMFLLNHDRLNEKLMTLLLKLGEFGKCLDLLDNLKQKSNPTLNFLKELPVAMVAPDPQAGSLYNFSETFLEVVGREREFAEVKRQLLELKHVAIVGLPGMGKSYLGYAVAQDLIFKFDIIWICNAENETTLDASLKTLASALGVIANANENYIELSRCLSSYKRVLLLLDNALISMQSTYDKLEAPGLHVLLTTTDSNFKNPYPLNGWPVEFSIDYLTRGKKTTFSRTELQEVVHLFSCLPLALKISKGFIQSENRSAADLLYGLSQVVNEREPPVVSLIKFILNIAIESKGMKKFLCLRALLSADNVPLVVFRELASGIHLNWPKSLKSAYSLCLLEVTPDSSSMNRIVQSTILKVYKRYTSAILPQLTQTILKQLEEKAYKKEILNCTFRTLEYIINLNLYKSYSSFCTTYVRISRERNIAKEITEALQGDTDARINEASKQTLDPNMLVQMAVRLEKAGKFKMASNYAKVVIKNIETEELSDQAIIYEWLGGSYETKVDFLKAEECYLNCLKICEEIFDPKKKKAPKNSKHILQTCWAARIKRRF